MVWSGPTPGPVTGRVVPGAAGLPRTVTTFGAYPWACLPVVDENTGVPAACLLTGPHTWPQPRDDESDPLPFVMIGPADGAFIQRLPRPGRRGARAGRSRLPLLAGSDADERHRAGASGTATARWSSSPPTTTLSSLRSAPTTTPAAPPPCSAWPGGSRRSAGVGRTRRRPSRRRLHPFRLFRRRGMEQARLLPVRRIAGARGAAVASEGDDQHRLGGRRGRGLPRRRARPCPSLAAALRAMASGERGDAEGGGAADVLRRLRVVVSPDGTPHRSTRGLSRVAAFPRCRSGRSGRRRSPTGTGRRTI